LFFLVVSSFLPFPPITQKYSSLSTTHDIWPAHLNLLHLIILIILGKVYKL
jgi:hypothetical protein